MSQAHIQIPKLDLRTGSTVPRKITELLSLFPEARTDGGKIDFDRLRLALGETIDIGKERFGLTWPGKADCFKVIQNPTMATLRPAPGESVNWDVTEHLVIEGDNLEVLKLLQKSYVGKVKMIYIDPPYNTGNDFIYPDDFSETLDTYLRYTGQIDAQGRKFGTNTDTEGRFHSKWLNMMYPRLYLARNLLRQDGVLFVSIGEEEIHNLLKICNEIFGEENSCGLLVWEKKKKPSFLDANMGRVTDYIVCFARDRQQSPPFLAGTVEVGKKYPFNNAGNGIQVLSFPPRSVCFRCPDQRITAQDMSEGNIKTELLDDVVIADGRNEGAFRLKGEWRYSQAKLDEIVANGGDIVISKVPFRPNYINMTGEAKKTANLLSYRTNGVPTNEDATNELRELFGADVMTYPKPSGLIKYLARAVCRENDIVMDFFAGSGTTGHAILDLNEEEGTAHKVILVQLPEPVDPSTPAGQHGLKSVAEICKERMRRVIQRFGDGESEGRRARDGLFESGESTRSACVRDVGFRVFKLDESNFAPWDADTPSDANTLGEQLELHVQHIRESRSEDDILYELLLKSGFPLTTPVAATMLAGKKVNSIAEGAMLICLERELTLELIRKMAKMKPERVVCLDIGFAGNDQLKANAVQEFRNKGVTSFRTV